MTRDFTGLPGHRRFLATLDAAMTRSDAGRRVGVVLLRVRHLSEIKSNHGFDHAESLVQAIATRATDILRGADDIERIDDGCLAIVLPDLSAPAQAELAAVGIVRACQHAYEAGSERLMPKVDVGIAMYPGDARHAVDLVRCADLAAADAADAPNGYAVYTPEMARLTQATRTYQIERELEGAINRDELHLHLQPKVRLRDGHLVGAEALLRWTRGDGRAIAPDVFIPVAEQSNLIVPLTIWTLNTAMRACGDLFDRDPAFSVAVNLSPVALNDPDIFNLIAQAASIWCADRSQLVLEITETALFRDPQTAARTLDEFTGEGIRLSIDDFGTGYSSLAQLARLNLAELKIDRSFIFDLMRDARNMQIVRSVIDLAHNFGMTVVAEGIEDAETYSCLATLGCDHGQGYHIARPMTIEKFFEWAEKEGCTCAVTDLA